MLTDSKYEVLTLLRSHRDDDKGFAVMARHPYPMHVVRLRQQVTEQELVTALQAGAEQGQNLKGEFCSCSWGGGGEQGRKLKCDQAWQSWDRSLWQ